MRCSPLACMCAKACLTDPDPRRTFTTSYLHTCAALAPLRLTQTYAPRHLRLTSRRPAECLSTLCVSFSCSVRVWQRPAALAGPP